MKANMFPSQAYHFSSGTAMDDESEEQLDCYIREQIYLHQLLSHIFCSIKFKLSPFFCSFKIIRIFIESGLVFKQSPP